MVMDKYYPQDNLQDLREKIHSLHLSYLDMEESPQKIEHRNKLEDCINNYLCHVPHSHKFEFPQTADVLFKSASSNKDFSGYKAARGWDAIGRYAANLLTKPWRREYRHIKMYSGFYIHEVESNLVGAELIFQAMGYRQYGREILILEGPVCPDRVTSVSLDSLIAYVECQILKAVWEEVSKVFNVSWLDVLKFRETHLCSPKQLVHSLIYNYHQRQYQEKSHSFPQSEPMCNSSMGSKLQMHHHMPMPPIYQAMHQPHPHMVTPCMYPVNGCCGGYIYPPQQYTYLPVNCAPPKSQYASPYYKHNSVPTAQLIELDHTYDTPDGPMPLRTSHPPKVDEIDRKMRQLYVNERKTLSETKNSDRDDGSGTFESWDYVYKNLESQGYSKDLGERGDILSQPLDADDTKKSSKLNNTLTRTPKNEIRERKKSDSQNIYDNVQGTIRSTKTNGIVKAERKPINSISKTDKARKPDVTVTNNGEASSSGWQCSTCTYLNSASKEICEMCSKSKKPKVDEIEVGGAQCVKCTYVNTKDEKICVVCGASLNNSATYI